MLEDLLTMDIMNALVDTRRIDCISELRIRINSPIRYLLDGAYHTLYEDDEVIVASRSHIESIISHATKRSMYAYNDQIIKGYIAYDGGIRIGIGGEAIETDGKVSAFRHINCLNIRIPHEIKGIAREIMQGIEDIKDSILIVSKPGVGKTTLLRDYVRCLSNSGINVLLVDERYEISVMNNGQATLSLGENTDIIAGISKINAYEMGIRCLAPDMLATDEIFGLQEVSVIKDIIRSGVGVIATMHASDVEDIKKSDMTSLLTCFKYIVTISISDGKRCYSLTKL